MMSYRAFFLMLLVPVSFSQPLFALADFVTSPIKRCMPTAFSARAQEAVMYMTLDSLG